MSATSQTAPRTADRRTTVLIPLALLGAGLVALGFFQDPQRTWGALLSASLWGLAISLGGAVLLALAIVTGGRWIRPIASVPVRISRLLPIPAVLLMLTLALGAGQLYPWMSPETVAGSPLLQLKTAWLDPTLFLARAAAWLLIWIALATSLGGRMMKAIAQPAVKNEARLGRGGALFLVLFALTISGAYWDWSMSLEPEWFSTMKGVYGFAGTFVGGIALTALVITSRITRGVSQYTPKALHDVGKLLFAFSFFWGYIWYCQFMLIWYANIPEESGYYVHRLTQGWEYLFIANAVFNFAIPFVVLLSAKAKMRASTLLKAAAWVLFARWFDTWMMVGPSLRPQPAFPLYELGAVLAVGAAMAFWFTRRGGVGAVEG